MWDYPKSPRHQAAIDKMKAEQPCEAARPAQVKQRREIDPTQVTKDQEAARLATQAKTARLRAARLARTDESAKKSKRR
jgi:hypothetical protein